MAFKLTYAASSVPGPQIRYPDVIMEGRARQGLEPVLEGLRLLRKRIHLVCSGDGLTCWGFPALFFRV